MLGITGNGRDSIRYCTYRCHQSIENFVLYYFNDLNNGSRKVFFVFRSKMLNGIAVPTFVVGLYVFVNGYCHLLPLVSTRFNFSV